MPHRPSDAAPERSSTGPAATAIVEDRPTSLGEADGPEQGGDDSIGDTEISYQCHHPREKTVDLNGETPAR
jgi:hypothetical protein